MTRRSFWKVSAKTRVKLNPSSNRPVAKIRRNRKPISSSRRRNIKTKIKTKKARRITTTTTTTLPVTTANPAKDVEVGMPQTKTIAPTVLAILIVQMSVIITITMPTPVIAVVPLVSRERPGRPVWRSESCSVGRTNWSGSRRWRKSTPNGYR